MTNWNWNERDARTTRRVTRTKTAVAAALRAAGYDPVDADVGVSREIAALQTGLPQIATDCGDVIVTGVDLPALAAALTAAGLPHTVYADPRESPIDGLAHIEIG